MSWRVDAVIGVILFALAAWIGASYVRTVIEAGGKPRFYQGEFGPAVMAACGRGYVNPDLDALPALKSFLDLGRDAFACSELGATVAAKPLSPMQVAFRYQEMTIATSWRWTGVSWSGLAPLYGTIFALTTLAAYGLFRTSVSALTATLGAIALSGSTIQLIYLPHFRDYSKAPFLLAAALALAWLATRRLSPRALVAAGAAYGVLLGIGVGFRNDLLIAMPPFVAVVLLFSPDRIRDRVPVKIAAIAVCVGALWLAMLPMRAIYAPGGGNSMQHVVVLGLGDSFNADLGVSNDGLYSWGSSFTDEYAHAQISSHATRMWNAPSALPLYGPEYDRSATMLLTRIVSTFPGDMLTRVYASVIRTLAIPYSTTSRRPPTLVSDPTILRGYSFRDGVLRSAGAIWPWLVVGALAGLSLTNLRLALLVTALVFYFAAYPVLQFNERHFFHLEVIAWWALLLVAESAVLLLTRAANSSRRRDWIDAWRARRWVAPVRRAGLVWAAAAVLIVVPLAVLRSYQSGAVRSLLSSYLALDKEPLDRSGRAVGEGMLRLAGDLTPPEGSGDAIQTTYLLAEFAAGACESIKFDVTVRYDAPPGGYNFTRTLQVRPPLTNGGVRRIFAAVYSHPHHSEILEGEYRLAGLDLPAESASCVSGLYKIRDVHGLPLVLDVNLPSDWEQAALYQTLDGVETRRRGEPAPDVYTFPPDLAVGRSVVVSPVTALDAAAIEKRASTLETNAQGWHVDGTGGVGGRGPFLYLAQMKPRESHAGELLLARGRLDHGGFSLGLVKDGEWIAQVPVLVPGDFVVVIRVPQDGAYSVVLANNLPGRSLHNRLTIDHIGWTHGA